MEALRRYYIVERELEIELVGRLRAGDKTAFDEIYAHFNRRLLSFLVRMARDRSLAEDLLEETWFRLVSAGQDLRPDTCLGAWLFTVARNVYISYCRSRLRETSYTGDLILLWPGESPKNPFDLASLNEFENRLEAAIAALPLIYREAILLVGIEQLRPTDAASVCGISPESMRQRVKRARDLLSRVMGKEDSSKTPEEEATHVLK
ncbi:MAG TPA: RNA polymerase sigma factor [Dongiaceae bacterium]|nr:RNA polymerase sigma factor [Dongiaceae bacterium]